MRRMHVFFVIAIVLGGRVLDAWAGVPEERAALIVSVDGMRGDYVTHPEKYGLKIPVMKKLMERGSRADAVLGVFPSVTYPSHTTLITGCYPGKHGVLANGVFGPPTAKPSGRWYWDYSEIKAPTLLGAARSAGWTTSAVSWPVTVGAPVDYLFPEVWDADQYDDRLVAISRNSVPRDLLAAVATQFDIGPSVSDDEKLTRVARHIVEKHRPRLMLLHLVGADHAQHSKGPIVEGTAAPRECVEELEKIDTCIGQLLASYAQAGMLEQTLIAIVSDHGFLPIDKSFNVNAVLRKAGLIRFETQDAEVAKDWDAVAWNAGASSAIILNNSDDKAVSRRVQAALAPYVGTEGKPIRRMFAADDETARRGNTRAAFMLDAGDGFTFGSRLKGEEITRSGMRGMHGQCPDRPGMDAALILAGPGLRAGANPKQVRMIDIAPTIAAAVGLTLDGVDGQPRTDLLLPAATAGDQHTPR